ncbi:MAG: SET domain-containing protein [Chitinophagaceae bacterium]|nr:SET domain-containing protein [Chitinophagaceae bacterium]
MKSELYALDIPEADYLYTQASQIPNAGLGLFTAIPLYKGDIIATFKGEVLNRKEAEFRIQNKDDDYFMNLPNGCTLDCKNTPGFAKMANDYLYSNFKQNAIITMNDNKVVLVASKTIQARQEIFTSYGKNYWERKGANV